MKAAGGDARRTAIDGACVRVAFPRPDSQLRGAGQGLPAASPGVVAAERVSMYLRESSPPLGAGPGEGLVAGVRGGFQSGVKGSRWHALIQHRDGAVARAFPIHRVRGLLHAIRDHDSRDPARSDLDFDIRTSRGAALPSDARAAGGMQGACTATQCTSTPRPGTGQRRQARPAPKPISVRRPAASRRPRPWHSPRRRYPNYCGRNWRSRRSAGR
jgi:hypothetical protein